MDEITIRTTSDGERPIGKAELERLADGFGGTLLLPDSGGYAESRSVWNAMIDRRPALIARCAGADDVARTVRFAGDRELLLSVRGGGHNIAGNAVCDGGLMLSLEDLRKVDVDAAGRTARVGGGATLGELDGATQEHALATPVGINSTTGIGGLTLGGGFGWLSRKHGMTVDNLRSVEIVTADGQIRRVGEKEDPDLFWAVRGGGGNFGVVTSFEFDLHPVGPEVLAGLIVHPLENAAELLRFQREVLADLGDETSVFTVLRKAPPLPFLPEAWHGRQTAIVAVCHLGDAEEGERRLEPLRRFGEPIADVIGPKPYVAWQQAFDPLLAPGMRNYWKSHDLADLPDGAIETLVDFGGRLPSPHCEVFVIQMGGASSRVAPDATAYPNRDTNFIVNVHTRWERPDEDEACIGWARGLFDALAPHATGSVYVNFMPEDEGGRIRGAYGPNFDRLAELKSRYDPENLFRMNHNIRPAVPA